MSQAERIEQWRASLHLLRAWAGSWKALGKHLPKKHNTLRQWAHKDATQKRDGRVPSEDSKNAILELRERWEEEHVQSADRIALLKQVLLQIEKANDMYEVETIYRRTKKILDEKDDALCEA